MFGKGRFIPCPQGGAVDARQLASEIEKGFCPTDRKEYRLSLGIFIVYVKDQTLFM
jgi:hypothetical protein